MREFETRCSFVSLNSWPSSSSFASRGLLRGLQMRSAGRFHKDITNVPTAAASHRHTLSQPVPLHHFRYLLSATSYSRFNPQRTFVIRDDEFNSANRCAHRWRQCSPRKVTQQAFFYLRLIAEVKYFSRVKPHYNCNLQCCTQRGDNQPR